MALVLEEAEAKTSARQEIRAGNREAPKLSELRWFDWIGGLFVSLALLVYLYSFIPVIFIGVRRLL